MLVIAAADIALKAKTRGSAVPVFLAVLLIVGGILIFGSHVVASTLIVPYISEKVAYLMLIGSFISATALLTIWLLTK